MIQVKSSVSVTLDDAANAVKQVSVAISHTWLRFFVDRYASLFGLMNNSPNGDDKTSLNFHFNPLGLLQLPPVRMGAFANLSPLAQFNARVLRPVVKMHAVFGIISSSAIRACISIRELSRLTQQFDARRVWKLNARAEAS
jgi:hypothetical protein